MQEFEICRFWSYLWLMHTSKPHAISHNAHNLCCHFCSLARWWWHSMWSEWNKNKGTISNSCLDKGTIIVPGDWRLVISLITEKVQALEEFMFKDYGEWWEWQAKPYTSEIVNAQYNKITKASRRIVPNSWYCISQQIQKPNLQILRQKIASVPVYVTEKYSHSPNNWKKS